RGSEPRAVSRGGERGGEERVRPLPRAGSGGGGTSAVDGVHGRGLRRAAGRLPSFALKATSGLVRSGVGLRGAFAGAPTRGTTARGPRGPGAAPRSSCTPRGASRSRRSRSRRGIRRAAPSGGVPARRRSSSRHRALEVVAQQRAQAQPAPV